MASILKTMGVQFNTQTLRELIKEFDEDGEVLEIILCVWKKIGIRMDALTCCTIDALVM